MSCFPVLAHSHFTTASLVRTGFKRRILETMKKLRIMTIGHSERIILTPFPPSAVDVKQPGFVVKASLKKCWTQSEIGVRRIYSDLFFLKPSKNNVERGIFQVLVETKNQMHTTLK